MVVGIVVNMTNFGANLWSEVNRVNKTLQKYRAKTRSNMEDIWYD
jgi:hypothetical protein